MLDDRKLVDRYLTKYTPTTPLEYPVEGATGKDGWTELTGLWEAPSGAKQVIVELHGRWAAKARMQWSDIEFRPTEAPTPRTVRLATVHYRPQAGKTPEEKRTQFGAFIEQAARQKADLVVLPETLTYFHAGASPVEVAEPIPGPRPTTSARWPRSTTSTSSPACSSATATWSTTSRCSSAPTAELAASTARCCLPRRRGRGGHRAAARVPGLQHALRQARADGLLRRLLPGGRPRADQPRRRGDRLAGVGLQPALAGARACENHVYLVSSTYEDVSRNWMISAVYGPHAASDRPGQGLGHRGRRGGRSECHHSVAQPGGLPFEDPTPCTHGACRAQLGAFDGVTTLRPRQSGLLNTADSRTIRSPGT